MKYIKILAAVLALCVSSAVSYHIGYNKSYEVACRMGDLIRCYEDHLHEDSLIEDYGCFDELIEDFLYDEKGKPINIDNYVYCY